MLDSLPLEFGRPKRRDTKWESAYNLVIEVPARNKKVRRLPGLYNCATLVFADRDVNKVTSDLVDRLVRLRRADQEAIYPIVACELDGHCGLYARDSYNRSPYRRKLTRAGMTISSDPFVTLLSSGQFSSRDRAPFICDFVILGADGDELEEVVPTSRALLPFTFANYRVGSPDAQELSLLASSLSDTIAASSGDPGSLLRYLRERLGKGRGPS